MINDEDGDDRQHLFEMFEQPIPDIEPSHDHGAGPVYGRKPPPIALPPYTGEWISELTKDDVKTFREIQEFLKPKDPEMIAEMLETIRFLQRLGRWTRSFILSIAAGVIGALGLYKAGYELILLLKGISK